MQVERRPIRVMLVEDHNLVRAGIRAVIDGQSDIQVIAEATEGREAIRLARANCPDVAVVDVAMPGMSGIEVTRDIRRLCPQTQVLILTAHDNEEYFFQTLKAGAVGYVLKKAAASDLIAAIGGILIGIIYSISDGYFSVSWTQILVFAILIFVLVFRPTGLLGMRVPEK